MRATHLDEVFWFHRKDLRSWSAQAKQTAGLIADEVWDEFERELNDLLSDGLIWDFADTTRLGLLMGMVVAFDAACDRWIAPRIQAMHETMQAAAGAAWVFDAGGSSLGSLRESLRLRQSLAPQFDEWFRKARPGVFSVLSRALKNDVDYVIEHMEKDARSDAERLHRIICADRASITAELAQAATMVPQRSAHELENALLALELHATGRTAAPVTAPAPAIAALGAN